MVIDFSAIDIRQQPVLILCNLDDTPIGVLGNAFHVKLIARYNEVSELTFDLPAYANGIKTQDYDKVIGLRIIDLKGYGRFVLVNPKISSSGIKEIKGDNIRGLTIEGSEINGGTINGAQINVIGNSGDSDFNVYDMYGGRYGFIRYDDSGSGSQWENRYRMFIGTDSGKALKIKSGENLSIDANGYVYFGSEVVFSGRVRGGDIDDMKADIQSLKEKVAELQR